jgi:hypothetical protein
MSGRSLIEKSLGRGRPLRFLLVLLLGLQALVAAAHFHSSYYYPADPANSQISPRSSGDRPSTDDPADCSICHFLSLMGDALLPSGIVFFLSGTLLWWSINAALPGQTHCARSRGWRSRAPPVLS